MAAHSGQRVEVHGLRELQRDLKACEKDVRKEVQGSLKLAAVPVVEQARANLARFQGASLNTIRPKLTIGRVRVEQSARKVTGQRPDWGATQMVYGLIPALNERQGEVLHIMEDQLARFTGLHGLPMRERGF
jgi:hypothetical protein